MHDRAADRTALGSGHSLARFAGATALAVGVLALAGWAFGVAALETVALAATTAALVLAVALYLLAAGRERGEVARREAEELFRTAFDASPSGMLMVDPAGRIVLLNRQAETIFGYRSDELLGQPVEMLLPERLRVGHEEHRRGFLAEPRTRQMGAGRDLRARRKGGREVPVEIGLNPVERDEGTHVLASIIDITERKRVEDELRRSNEELERFATERKRVEDELRRSNEELERFAYVASHDLQEPLRMVGSYVQLLARRYRGKLDADADDFIGYALDGALRMHRLIEELLAFSRVSTRGADPVPTDAGAAVAGALRSLKLAIEEAGATVTVGPLPTVLADPGQLEQVFLNLISNALKFRGFAPPEIQVSAERRDRAWELRVRDNGIGIEPQYFERIFVIFQRLHGREEYPGTGMGLAIVKKIVERHGGRIGVESTPGDGSVFTFTLPAVERAEEEWA